MKYQYKSCDHPNINKLIDVYQNSIDIFLVLEYHQVTLYNYLGSNGEKLDEKLTLKIIQQVIGGLNI